MSLSEQFLRSVALRAQVTDKFYPFSVPAIAALARAPIHFHPSVTFLIGENGSGKSTLVEGIAIAAGFNPEGGSRNFNFSTRDSHSQLGDLLRLTRGIRRPKDGFFLRAESFYNVASQIDDLGVSKSYGGSSLHTKSHGESFLALMMNRFGRDGLYILDEPEAALSPSRQLSMLRLLRDCVADGCQFIIATHSPIIMAYPDAVIIELSEHGMSTVLYDDTEHVQVTRFFLNNTEEMVHKLLSD